MGKSLAKLLDSLEISEPLVDCESCSVSGSLKRAEHPRPYKCCTFQPFWSAFQIAERLASGLQMPKWAPGAVFLPVGVVPPKTLREQWGLMGDSERWSSKSVVCSYFNLDLHKCSIFDHRPHECRRYYCASQNSLRRESLYQWAGDIERKALYKYLVLERKYSLESWGSWVAYLDEEGWRGDAPLNVMGSEEALSFYSQCYGWWSESLASIPKFNDVES